MLGADEDAARRVGHTRPSISTVPGPAWSGRRSSARWWSCRSRWDRGCTTNSPSSTTSEKSATTLSRPKRLPRPLIRHFACMIAAPPRRVLACVRTARAAAKLPRNKIWEVSGVATSHVATCSGLAVPRSPRLATRPARADDKVLAIGMSLPLTGELSRQAMVVRAGAQFAVDEANAKGGVAGYTLRLVVYDDASPHHRPVRPGAGGHQCAQDAARIPR